MIPVIDDEFRALIPPLTAEERAQLVENIVRDGCHDPLTVWNGVLLDGHHRLEICQEHGLTYQLIELQCCNREDAKAWIIQHQFGRRNLDAYQRSQLALVLEPLIAARAKEHQRLRGSEGLTTLSDLPMTTRGELAKIAGVSEGTLSKVKQINVHASDEDKEQLRAKQTNINAVHRKLKATGRIPAKKGKLTGLDPYTLLYGHLAQMLHELQQRRKDNADELGRRRWNPLDIDKRRQTEILNWIEQTLQTLADQLHARELKRRVPRASSVNATKKEIVHGNQKAVR